MLATVIIERVDWTLVRLNSNLAFSSFQVPEQYHAIRGAAQYQVTKHLRQSKRNCFNNRDQQTTKTELEYVSERFS